jgi:hypothetical protein
MKLYPFCDPYIWENPKALLATGFSVKEHKEGACASEYVNHVLFIYILFGMTGAVASVFVHSPYVLSASIGFATLYCLPTFLILVSLQQAKEGFADAAGSEDKSRSCGPNGCREIYDVIGVKGAVAAPANLSFPSARNPFMNVLIDEIKYNPTRPVATSIMDPSIKVGLDDFFRTEFNSDPTDVFGKTQSQRQFVAMPSTGIPNDVDSYQNWLYRIPGKTCKEGGREACLPGTDGGALPWMNANP